MNRRYFKVRDKFSPRVGNMNLTQEHRDLNHREEKGHLSRLQDFDIQDVYQKVKSLGPDATNDFTKCTCDLIKTSSSN